jgi:hypothetical protein
VLAHMEHLVSRGLVAADGTLGLQAAFSPSRAASSQAS